MATTVERPVIKEDISIHPPKRLLFGPGPSQVHPRVYQALAQPIVGHLDAYFFEISTDIQRMLRKVFGTTNEMTFVISATGSGGMETAISNFVTPGTKVVSLRQRFLLRSHVGDGAPPGRRTGALREAVGRGLRRRGSDGVHSPGEAEGRDVRAGGDFCRSLSARRRDLQGRARSRRAGHRRLRHLARRHAGGS